MKILFVSGCAPAKYNYGEPNAYPFYLIKEIAAHHETTVLYFNANKKITSRDTDEALKEAGVRKSAHIKTNRRINGILSLVYIPRAILLKAFILLGSPIPRSIAPLQLSVNNKFPETEFIDHVREFNPDLAIVFPMQMYFAIKKLKQMNIAVSLLVTDSLALHFERQLEVIDRLPVAANKVKQMLIQARKLERAYNAIRAEYFFVGEKDRIAFGRRSKQEQHCFFIPHHLYSYSNDKKSWNDRNGPINVVFAGGGNTIYTGDEADRIAECIVSDPELSKNKFEFFFLGAGYDRAASLLRAAGYSVSDQLWVDNYDHFMSLMHIQIFPIIVGTGTKAKVLAAMSSGLLCIGTWYSFENIQANRSEHYLQYDNPGEIPKLLSTIYNNVEFYKRVAQKGKARILEMHDSTKVVEQLLLHSARQ